MDFYYKRAIAAKEIKQMACQGEIDVIAIEIFIMEKWGFGKKFVLEHLEQLEKQGYIFVKDGKTIKSYVKKEREKVNLDEVFANGNDGKEELPNERTNNEDN